MNPKDIQMAHLVDMETPRSVCDEVEAIVSMMRPEFDFHPINDLFKDVIRFFNGNYPGYRKCNTEYHDIKHTTDTFLAMARLMHGVTQNETRFSKRVGRFPISTPKIKKNFKIIKKKNWRWGLQIPV